MSNLEGENKKKMTLLVHHVPPRIIFYVDKLHPICRNLYRFGFELIAIYKRVRFTKNEFYPFTKSGPEILIR